MVLTPFKRRELYYDPAVGKLRPIAGEPLLTSGHLDWRGYFLEHHSIPPSEGQDVVWMNHLVILQLHRPVEIECQHGQQCIRRRILPGQVRLRPANAPYSCRTLNPSEFITVSLEPNFIKSTCPDHGSDADSVLHFLDGVEDAFVESTCMALFHEAQSGGVSGTLYSESLATSLAVHLFSRYSTKGAPKQARGGLSSQSVRSAMDYIESNLGQNITLKAIAQSAGLSPFHFARQFKLKTGCSPYQFVLQKRIEKAKEMLLHGQHSISQIAAELGFSDQSHLTMHFKRQTGLTPRVFARRHGQVRRLPQTGSD